MFPQRKSWLKGRVLFLAVLAAVQGALCPDVSHAQSLTKLLPANAYWSAETSNLSDFDSAWKKTAGYALYSEPAMKPFWDDLQIKRPGVLPHVWLGLTWQALLDAGAKEVLWSTMPSQDGGKVATILILKPSSGEFANQCQTAFEKYWKERSAAIRSVKVGNANVVEASSPTRKSYFSVAPAGIVLCDKLDALAELIKQQTPQAKNSLADSAEFQTTQKSAPATAQLRWHLNPFDYWEAIHQDGSPQSLKILKRIDFYKQQGFGVIKAMGGGMTFGSSTGEADHSIRIVRAGPLLKGSGLLSLVTANKFSLPDWLPQSVSSITTYHWDVPSAITAYGHVYDDSYGDGNQGVFDETLTDIEEATDGPQAKLRGDVLQRLGPLFVVARDWGGEARPMTGSSTKLKKRRTVWIAPTSDPAKSAQAFEKFYTGDPEFTHEVLTAGAEKVTLWLSADPNVLMLGEKGAEGEERPLTPEIAALCVARGFVLAASDKEYLVSLLKGGVPAAEKSTQLFFSGESKIVSCGRYWRNTMLDAEPVFLRIKSSQLDSDDSLEQQVLYRLLVAKRKDDASWKPVDGGKLPDFAAISQYFGKARGSIYPEADGWSLRLISEYPSAR